MQIVSLSVLSRKPGRSSSQQARREGKVPGVVYGMGQPSRLLAVPLGELERLLHGVQGRNQLIRLEGEGLQPRTVIVKELQRDPIKSKVLHVDFQEISLSERLETKVPVRLIGEELARKSGGIIQHHLWEVAVQCLPTEIPDHLTADVSHLQVGDQVTVADLDVPAGVSVMHPSTDTVAALLAPRAEEKPAEEVPEAAEEGAEPAAPAPEDEGDS